MKLSTRQSVGLSLNSETDNVIEVHNISTVIILIIFLYPLYVNQLKFDLYVSDHKFYHTSRSSVLSMLVMNAKD